MHDLIIIGSGPSGLTASIYASRYKINHIVIGEIPGGLASEAHKICNWPGEIEISGPNLMNKIKTSAEKLGAEIQIDKIINITKQENSFLLKTSESKEYQTKTILIAMGTKPRKLDIDSEKQFLGRGVSYCATCDGPFFKEKIVAVLGGGNSAMTAALYLADLAKQVYIIYRGESLKGETVWIDQIKNNNKITTIYNTKVIDFVGNTKLEKVKLDNKFNDSDEIVLDGVFIEIGSEPDLELVKDLNIETENGHIKIKPDGSTSLDGIFASGDITNGSNHFRQIITAASEGAIASNSIHRYLSLKK